MLRMEVRGNHPLAEIIAKKLFAISVVPADEAEEMISRAARAAVEWHNNEVESLKQEIDELNGMMDHIDEETGAI
jgi:hypothetical protein